MAMTARSDASNQREDERRGHTDGGRGLTRITVNLTPRSALALDGVVERTGDSRTDVVNRSLLVYDLLLDLIARGDGRSLVLTCPDGGTERIYIL